MQDRVVTVREYARAQGFPDCFVFRGNKMAKYKQVLSWSNISQFLNFTHLDILERTICRQFCLIMGSIGGDVASSLEITRV